MINPDGYDGYLEVSYDDFLEETYLEEEIERNKAMKDLQKVILDNFEEKVTSGKIEEIVNSGIEKFTKDIINNVFRSWSDFGKAFEAKINKELMNKLNDISFDEYNKIIMEVVKKRVDTEYVGEAKARFNKTLDELFEKAPEEYKLSTLIKRLKEDSREDARENQWSEISLHIKSDYLTFIYIDPQPNKKDYDCLYRIWFNKEGIFCGATIKEEYRDDYNLVSKPFLTSGTLSGLERDLFHMITQGTKIILDNSDDDLYYEYED